MHFDIGNHCDVRHSPICKMSTFTLTVIQDTHFDMYIHSDVTHCSVCQYADVSMSWYVSVCMYVCGVGVCMGERCICVSIYVCMYVCLYLSMNEYIYICMNM